MSSRCDLGKPAPRIIRDLGHGSSVSESKFVVPALAGIFASDFRLKAVLQTTPATKLIATAQEIDLLTQNGPNVEVGYASGGGAGATTITFLWQIDGIDHSIAATPPLQTIGPFSMGQTIRFKTRAENTAGTTENIVKQITIM